MHNVSFDNAENVSSKPFVSVIVPTFNDNDRVCKCIEALQRQSYPSSKYEIIVVDNASAEPLTYSCDEGARPEIIFLTETKVGSYAARNAGIARSKGEILAFTDSDCLPEIHWIENGVFEIQRAGRNAIIGGEVCLFEMCSGRPNTAETLDMHFGLRQERFINFYGFSATANLFAPSEIFNKVGVFNSGLKSSGDKEWCLRAASYGYKIKYAENVLVFHPARKSLSELIKKAKRKSGGEFDFASNSLSGGKVSKTEKIKMKVNSLAALVFIARKHGSINAAKLVVYFLLIAVASFWERVLLRFGRASQRA